MNLMIIFKKIVSFQAVYCKQSCVTLETANAIDSLSTRSELCFSTLELRSTRLFQSIEVSGDNFKTVLGQTIREMKTFYLCSGTPMT